ncbi:TPA: SH3 domain-containing protein [Bacillus cereus]|nr:SH3 domain-containing protein [Bacillus cereus]
MNKAKKATGWKKPIMVMATAALLGTGMFGMESPFSSPTVAHADSATYKVTADKLNVRSAASTSGSKIGSVYEGQLLSVISRESNGWYKINHNGRTGYVSGEFVQASGGGSVQTSSGYTVTADKLNVRSAASTSGSKIGSVYEGQSLSVISQESNGWYKINFNGRTGYVSGEFVKGGGAQPPKTDNNTSSGGQAVNGTYRVTATALNVRSGSNPGTRSLGIVYNNQTLSVIGQEGNGWYKINFNGQTGYVSNQYVSVNGSGGQSQQGGEQTNFPRMSVPAEMQRDYSNPSRDLQTGCEITAVSMMLRYAGADVDKIKLAKEMPYHSSNPNKGYVGNPWGDGPINTIYPSALTGLVSNYTGSSVNLTGSGLDSIKDRLNKKHPVVAWVGNMHGFGIHAITLTGYDNSRVFYNDPWTGEKDASMSWGSFNNKWSSKGNKALSY